MAYVLVDRPRWRNSSVDLASKPPFGVIRVGNRTVGGRPPVSALRHFGRPIANRSDWRATSFDPVDPPAQHPRGCARQPSTTLTVPRDVNRPPDPGDVTEHYAARATPALQRGVQGGLPGRAHRSRTASVASGPGAVSRLPRLPRARTCCRRPRTCRSPRPVRGRIRPRGGRPCCPGSGVPGVVMAVPPRVARLASGTYPV